MYHRLSKCRNSKLLSQLDKLIGGLTGIILSVICATSSILELVPIASYNQSTIGINSIFLLSLIDSYVASSTIALYVVFANNGDNKEKRKYNKNNSRRSSNKYFNQLCRRQLRKEKLIKPFFIFVFLFHENNHDHFGENVLKEYIL